jgi:putative SOS response-associated peptidase YedK
VTKNTDIFSVAGLWEGWMDNDGNHVFSFTIITQPASPKIAHIHDRMPEILLLEQERLWINLEMPVEEAVRIIEPYTDDYLDF